MAALQRELVTYGEPCLSGEPLRVTARLAEGIVLRMPLMLDGLLAWSVATDAGLLAPLPGERSALIEIPIQHEPRGRFHLCSQSLYLAEVAELRHKNRRAPYVEMTRFGSSKIRRVDIAAGANKSYRVPYSIELLSGDELSWYCLGNRQRIFELLTKIHYLGRHRGAGKGRLDLHRDPWRVEACEPWGDGFPVVGEDGAPLRPLPMEWPGVTGGRRSFRVLTFPYYERSREEQCVAP